MSKDMKIEKTDSDNHYHVEVDGLIEEDVNDIQLLGMLRSNNALNATPVPDILYRLSQLPKGSKIAVPYN